MTKKTILFLDNTYPEPYQLVTLKQQAIGGTEASIVKTAAILSSRYHVIVAQKFRNEVTIEHEDLHFIPKKDMYTLQIDFIIVLRKYPLLKKLQQKFPTARLFLWLHTYKNIEYVFKRRGLAKTNTTVICNSKTHRNDTDRLLNLTILAKSFSIFIKKTRVKFCYNPISKPQEIHLQETHLKELDYKKDENKLLFFSSPNKGLQQVLDCFEYINKELPDLRLYIANPGYKIDHSFKLNKNIIVLGSLPHEEMMTHVKESLCVFYPQDTFAETFGLIYAEANSYGVPVLAHDIGSAREILDKNNQLVDARDYQQIIQVIKKWQKKYPKISYEDAFSDERVLQQWRKLLGSVQA